MYRKPPVARLTKSQSAIVITTQVVQKGIRIVTFGKVRPHWSLPIAVYFVNGNRKQDEQHLEEEIDPLQLTIAA